MQKGNFWDLGSTHPAISPAICPLCSLLLTLSPVEEGDSFSGTLTSMPEIRNLGSAVVIRDGPVHATTWSCSLVRRFDRLTLTSLTSSFSAFSWLICPQLRSLLLWLPWQVKLSWWEIQELIYNRSKSIRYRNSTNNLQSLLLQSYCYIQHFFTIRNLKYANILCYNCTFLLILFYFINKTLFGCYILQRNLSLFVSWHKNKTLPVKLLHFQQSRNLRN